MELHDVLAHSLTVIVAQADGIRFIHRTEPDAVEGASTVIAESARTALIETRRLIEGFSAALSDHPNHEVEDLALLAERLRSSGMPVTIETTGEPWALTAAQQLTVYRLAQESLTNAFKHGDRKQGAHLHLIWTAASLELRCGSSLTTGHTATSTPPSGRGLAGMRARAAAVGGWIETVRGEETFEVLAFLPATGPDRCPESAPAAADLPVLDGALL